MGCCDPVFNEAEHDELHAGQCPVCGGDVDEDGATVETNNCGYSPEDCSECGHRPCDLSC
jgi:hypothetical protein